MAGGGRFNPGRAKKGPAGLDKEPKWNIDYTPPPTYPPIDSPRTRIPTKDEKETVALYRRFREACRDGPLHTVLGDTFRVKKSDGRVVTSVVKFNSFEGMPTYTTKYKRKKRTVPELHHRPYIAKYFPEELWATLGPEYAAGANTPSSVASKKRMLERARQHNINELEASILAAEKKGDEETDPDKEQDNDEAEGEARPDDVDAADKDDIDEDEEQADPLAEEVDDDFEDQEDGEDAADDDYNAEKYFDPGDEYSDAGGGDDFDGGVVGDDD